MIFATQGLLEYCSLNPDYSGLRKEKGMKKLHSLVNGWLVRAHTASALVSVFTRKTSLERLTVTLWGRKD